MKKQLVCGYPKIQPKACSTQDALINGRCGLLQLLSQPFTFSKKPKTAKQLNALKEQKQRVWKQKYEAIKNRKTISNTLQSQSTAKKAASNIYVNMIKKMFPQMSLLPKQCTNIYCRAQRKIAKQNEIDDYFSVAPSVSTLLENAADGVVSIAGSAFDILKTVGSGTLGITTSVIGGTYNTFKKGFSAIKNNMLYKYCPRRAGQLLQNQIGSFLQGLMQNNTFGINSLMQFVDPAKLMQIATTGISVPDLLTTMTNAMLKKIGESFQTQLMSCITKTAGLASIGLNVAGNIKNKDIAGLKNTLMNGNNFAFASLIMKDGSANTAGIMNGFSKKIFGNISNANISTNSIGGLLNTNLLKSGLNMFKNNDSLKSIEKQVSRQIYINQRIEFFVNQYKSLTNKDLKFK